MTESDLIDKLLDAAEVRGLNREEIFGQDGLLKHLTERLFNTILEAEMEAHIGYHKNAPTGNFDDRRNGYSVKTVLTENQIALIKVPRTRDGTFEPRIIPKREKHVPLSNDQIILMYGFGMTERDIKVHLEQIYNENVSPEMIGNIANVVLEDVAEWRNRPLEKYYAIVYLDALRVKSTQDGKECTQSVYVAIGVNFEGEKAVLGLWVVENDGVEFWMGVLNEMKTRGVEDFLVACMDGLTGLSEAVDAVYPNTHAQLCIAHMLHDSSKFFSYKDLRELCADLKAVSHASLKNLT
jgi:transposase-like protein